MLGPVTGHSWQIPKPPAGYVCRWVSSPAETPVEQRAESYALYRINDDAELELDAHHAFFKIPDADGATEPKRSHAEIEAEYQATRRREELRYRAARLAAPKVAGTPLEGRAFWPLDPDWVEGFQEDDDGNAVVALLVKVPREELEAQMAEAERRYELEQQELAEEAALSAEANEPDDEDLDPNVNDAAPAELESAGA